MLQTIANSPNKRKKSHKNGWLRAIFLAFVSPYLAYIMFSQVLSFWFTEFCKISFCRLGEENADQDDPFGRGYQPFNSQRYDWLQEETKTHSSLKSSRDLLFLNKKPWCFGVKSHPVLTPGSQFSSSSPKKIWSTINNNEWVVVNRWAFDSSWIVVEDLTVECGSVVLTLTYKLADE